MRECVIVDMDGTLCDVSSIRHMLPNFDKFHQESINCPPNPRIAEMVNEEYNKGREIIVVTARKAKHRHVTAMWLAINGIPSNRLIMRADKDNRPDYQVKADILKQIIKSGSRPVLAIDDNPNVVMLWVRNKIPTVFVEGYNVS